MTVRAGFTLVGQVVGASIGGPIGAAIGGMVGGLVGGAIEGPARNTQALIDDLGAIKFDYGSSWPRIYGSYRVKLAPIWSSEKRPVAHDEAVDSKGGPDQINRTFTYEQDWLCWAPLNATDWARIWINGKLRASRRMDSDDATIEASAETPAWADVTFYDGADDQLPWPVYEAAVGAENACAYRHRPTLAFASLDLGTGGQPPLIEVEFVSGSSVIEPGETIQFADDVAASNFPPGGSMRPMGAIAFGNPTRIPTFAAKADLSQSTPPPCCALDEEGIPIWSPPDVPSVKCWDVDSAGVAAVVREDLIPNPSQYSTYPGLGSGTRALVAIATRSVLPISVALVGDGVSAEYALPDEDNWLGETHLRFATWGSSIAISTALAVGARPTGITGTYVGNRGNIYICTDTGTHVSTIAAALQVEALAMNASTVWALSSGSVYPFALGSGAAGDSFACAGSSIFVSAAGDLCYVSGSAVYRRNGDEWALLGTMTGPTATTHVFGVAGAKLYAAGGVNQDTYLPLYTIRAFSGSWPRLDLAAKAYADYWFNSFTWGDSGAKRTTRNECYCVAVTATAPFKAKSWAATYWCERLYGYPGDSSGNFNWPLDEWVWYPASITVYIDLALVESELDLYVHDLFSQTFASLVTPQAIPLSEIVQTEALLEWTGEDGALGAGDIDVSTLADIDVTGFLTTGSPRESIAQLMDVFYFGATCSDKLYCRLRGGASVATVPAADTGAGVGQAGEVFAGLERGNDLEQAIQVAVTGPNLLSDYEPGTENSDRLVGSSVELRRYTTAVVFTPAERKGRADTMVLDGRVASHTGQVALDDAYMALEPCDVWLQYDDEGNAYRVRAERENYADGVRTFEVVLDDPTVLSISGITAARDTRALQVLGVADTIALLLDAPIVRDADDARGFYAVARRATPGRWAGFSLFKSGDGVAYASVAGSSSAGVFGTCSVVPGAWSAGRMFDERNAIVVDVGSGTLVSATRDAILSDTTVNAFAIGAHGRWLLGQYRDAELVSSGVYRLTGLLLGAGGTEQHIGTQVVGDKFALLRYASGMLRVAADATDQDTARYYKAVTVGQSTSVVSPQTFTTREVGLMPLSPVDARASRDAGDITITWGRRSRMRVRMIGPAGILVPLGEASESYSIDVFDDDTFTTVVRTLTSSTPTVVYTAAQQTTDFGSPQAEVSFAIHPISATVGRGFALRATL